MSTTMATSNTGGEKKQRGGRKTKSDWRKKIDLTDVEQGLEERREEERKGGAPIDQQNDAELFVVDVAGDEKTKTIQKKQKKKLRIDELLDARSKVPVPVIGIKMNEERKRKMQEKQRLNALRKIAGFDGKQRVVPDKLKTTNTSGTYDIWSAPPTGQLNAGPSASKKTAISRKKLLHLAATPAVEVAHPGASYRPEESQHKELIGKASNEYASILRSKQRYSGLKGFSGANHEDGVKECMGVVAQEIALETSKGDDGGTESIGKADSSSDDGSDSEKPKKKKPAKRKTRVQRNREKRRAQEDLERRVLKKQKELIKQVVKSSRIMNV
ncbi:hypothetical protein FB639_003733, partial [Coemansia asiatica]